MDPIKATATPVPTGIPKRPTLYAALTWSTKLKYWNIDFPRTNREEVLKHDLNPEYGPHLAAQVIEIPGEA